MNKILLQKILLEKQGFTLLEILLVAMLMSILFCLIMGLVVQSSRAFSLEEDLLTTKQTGELALEFMSTQLRMASSVHITENTSIHFTGYYTQEEALSFFLYTSAGVQALGFRVGTGTTRPLINQVAEICFQEDGSTIQITLTIEGRNGREVTQSIRVTPRNL